MLPMSGRVRPLRASSAISQVLRAPVVQRSAHFALHALNQGFSAVVRGKQRADPSELSTGVPQNPAELVDNLAQTAWFACVVPKRHARRAVTRNLIKRQIRATSVQVAAEAQGLFPAGAYVMRLNRPFTAQEFPSAASDALSLRVRQELLTLLRRVAGPARA
jgi:ribonuclease P protein component